MSFLELVKKRRSVRSYLDRPVEREKIERCLEAARLAPSACNSQPWSFVVVDDPQLKDRVAAETHAPLIPLNRFTHKAPVLIVIIAESPNLTSQIGGALTGRQFNLIDIGMACEHLCLQAVEEGLGTCIMGWFDEKAVKSLLGIPDKKRVALIISLGYPATDELRVKQRKRLEQIVSYNQFR
jgi:nitroreductase